MSTNDNGDQNPSISVPIGVLASALLLGLASAGAYVLSSRGEPDPTAPRTQAAKARKGLGRRFGLMTLVTLIENDATRKVLVAVLKAIARRS